MKVSVLTVTENRTEFMPWLLWNYERQAWPDKEMILVDSSDEPAVFACEHVTVIHAPGANVPAKRNIALAAATGDAITWLDDDDWRHPGSLKILAKMMDKSTGVSGGRWAWFLDLQTEQLRRFRARHGVLFNCLLADTAVARSVPFDETEIRGSDLTWLAAVLDGYTHAYTYEPLSIILCHDRNLGNRAEGHHFNRHIDEARAAIGRKAWGETSDELHVLRGRLWK